MPLDKASSYPTHRASRSSLLDAMTSRRFQKLLIGAVATALCVYAGYTYTRARDTQARLQKLVSAIRRKLFQIDSAPLQILSFRIRLLYGIY